MDPGWKMQPGTEHRVRGQTGAGICESQSRFVHLAMQAWVLNRAFIVCLLPPAAVAFTPVHAQVLWSCQARYWHIQLSPVLGIPLHLNMKYKSEIK